MSYAGDVSPNEAYQAVLDDPDAVIVDVRTRPELVFVGAPDLSAAGKQIIAVEWQTFPQGTVNTEFVNQLRSAGVAQTQPVYFLCRSGGRSRAAAILATEGGFESAFNIDAGFEGNPYALGHRGTEGGWKFAGLPWRQG
jgi:rhodanese-related sulfurtransferase